MYQDPFLDFSEHNVADNVPFLRTLGGEDAIYINHEKVKVFPKEHEAHLIPNLALFKIENQVKEVLQLSLDDYARRGESIYKMVEISEKNSKNELLYGQKGLFATNHIDAFTVLGIYAGYYITDPKEFDQIYQKFHPILVDRYMHGCRRDGLPAVSGYVGGNYMSYINDWRPHNFDELPELKIVQETRQNCLSLIGQADETYFVIYIAINNIWKDEEIFTDYGKGYWEREKFIKDNVLEMCENELKKDKQKNK